MNIKIVADPITYTYLPSDVNADRRRNATLESAVAAAQLGDRVMAGWQAVQRYVSVVDEHGVKSTCSVTYLLSTFETVWAIYVTESWKD